MNPARSLRGRLAIAMGLTILVVLAVAGLSVRTILTGMVTTNLETAMDQQVRALSRGVDAGGSFDPGKAHLFEYFENAPLRWGWEVRTPRGTWAGGTRLTRLAFAGDDRTGQGISDRGATMHLRRLRVPVSGGVAQIVVAAPRQIITEPMTAVVSPMLAAFALLTATLLVAAYLQLRYSLQPVLALRDAVARVRSGRAVALPERQPAELAPLAAEVNALIAQNAAGLDHARHHVANLAHGLKTPLATLMLRLAREGASAESLGLVAEMDRRIGHHLSRARSAAIAKGQRAVAAFDGVAGNLRVAMANLHEDRALDLAFERAPGLLLEVDPADLDEMLGNLIDNACRHARSKVALSARRDAGSALIEVADDGPGIAEEAMPRALTHGARLDESGAGYGFGLGIVRELAELYGGELELGRAALGGLSARLRLPLHG